MLIDVNVISKLIGLIKMLIFGRQSDIIALQMYTRFIQCFGLFTVQSYILYNIKMCYKQYHEYNALT